MIGEYEFFELRVEFCFTYKPGRRRKLNKFDTRVLFIITYYLFYVMSSPSLPLSSIYHLYHFYRHFLLY